MLRTQLKFKAVQRSRSKIQVESKFLNSSLLANNDLKGSLNSNLTLRYFTTGLQLNSSSIFDNYLNEPKVQDLNYQHVEDRVKFDITNVGIQPLIEEILKVRNKEIAEKNAQLNRSTLNKIFKLALDFTETNNEGNKRSIKKQLMTFLKVFKVCKGDADILYSYIVVLLSLFRLTSGHGLEALILNLLSIGHEYSNVQSSFTYSSYLYEGLGTIIPNKSKGLIIMKQLSDRGLALAKVKYGVWLIKDNQLDEGLKCLKMAADANFELAFFQLAHLYRKGVGVTKDLEKAIEYYKKALELGNNDSHFYLGTLYLDKSPVQAFHHFEQSAIYGHAEAQYNLGLLYFSGEGTVKDLKLAKEYWTMSAQQNFPLGMLNLGKLHLQNIEGISEKQEGIMWLEKVKDRFKTSRYGVEANALLENIDSLSERQIKIKTSKKDSGGCNIM